MRDSYLLLLLATILMLVFCMYRFSKIEHSKLQRDVFLILLTAVLAIGFVTISVVAPNRTVALCMQGFYQINMTFLMVYFILFIRDLAQAFSV
ncbi:MAG: hypothetical protein ACI4EK_04495, partial [Wujia sp.]